MRRLPLHREKDGSLLIAYMAPPNELMHLLLRFFLSPLQILMSVKGTRARMGAFARIWLPTTHVNAQGSTWEGTASTVSACLLLSLRVFLELYTRSVCR